jgi:hypothetical protein
MVLLSLRDDRVSTSSKPENGSQWRLGAAQTVIDGLLRAGSDPAWKPAGSFAESPRKLDKTTAESAIQQLLEDPLKDAIQIWAERRALPVAQDWLQSTVDIIKGFWYDQAIMEGERDMQGGPLINHGGSEQVADRNAIEQLANILASDPKHYLWTPSALSKETGLEKPTVAKALENNQTVFRESRVLSRDSQPLFALKSQPPSWRERLSYLRMLITNSTASL